MVLTKTEYCMLCGCYEAIAAKKPLITSNKMVLKNYFKDAFFVENNPQCIYDGINTVLKNKDIYNGKIKILSKNLREEWELQFKNLKFEIEKIISLYSKI